MSDEKKVTAVERTHGSPLVALGQRFNIEPNKLMEVLRGTVIKPSKSGHAATNEEVAAFCIVAQQYGLNPFLREIHAFASGEKGVVPIVGIDGWSKIINARGEFDGCEFEEVEAPDGKPDRITCRMFVKGREHPVSATERFSECYRNTIPWNTMPFRMLRHKAYMQAARYAFGLSGIYDEDEARDIVNVTPEKTVLPDGARTESVTAALKAKQEQAAPIVPTPPPQEPAAPAEPPPRPTGANEARGVVERINVKNGKGKKGPWTKTGVLISGEWYGTFDETLGADAKSLEGVEVVAAWKQDGEYKTLTAIWAADAPTSDAAEPNTEGANPPCDDDELPFRA